MSYVNLRTAGLGSAGRPLRIRSLSVGRGMGAAPAYPAMRLPLPPAAIAAVLRARADLARRRGMGQLGALPTGICIGVGPNGVGQDSGDGSSCTQAAPGVNWSAAQLAAYNKNLNPGVAPLTPADLVNWANASSARASQLLGGGAPAVGSGGQSTPAPSSSYSVPQAQPVGMMVGGAGSVSISDGVTGGSQLTAGDPFSLQILGAAPNQPVTYSQNGGSPVAMGSTDSSGSFTLNGTVPSQPLGQWVQTWYVGGSPVQPSPLSFTVIAGANSAAAAASSSPLAAASASGVDLSFLTNSVSLLGFDVPVWMLGAVVIGGVVIASSGGSGRGRG